MRSSDRFGIDWRWAAAATLVLIPLVAPRTGSGGEVFTIEDVLASPFPTTVTASETGSRVAWVFTLRGVANVWVAEGPDFDGRRLTAFMDDDGRPLEVLGFSPDNEWVFFAKSSRFNPDQRALGSGPSKLYRVGWAGGEPEELAEVESAAVSPVEPQLAFIKEGNELWLVEPGEEATKVVHARGELSEPRWSPDGRKLVMATMRGKFPHRYSFITVYDTETQEIRYLDASVYRDLRPVWSPDGTRVAFLRRLTGGQVFGLMAKTVSTPDPWEIRVADVATGETVRAWRSPDSDTFYFADLAWFDERRLVFRSERDGWRHLYLVGADGSGLQQLTSGEYEVEAFEPAHELFHTFRGKPYRYLGYLDAIALVDGQCEFQSIDRIEPRALVAEQGIVEPDLIGRDL